MQLASGGTARLLSHLAGARQMSAGVKLARCHSGREGQNLFHKCAKSLQDKVAHSYFKYCKLAKNFSFLLTQIFLHLPSHLQLCSSPLVTQLRQRWRRERGPAQPRAGTGETRSPEMPLTREPARQSVEMLKKDRRLTKQGNPVNRSQAWDARTQVQQLHFKVL